MVTEGSWRRHASIYEEVLYLRSYIYLKDPQLIWGVGYGTVCSRGPRLFYELKGADHSYGIAGQTS